MKRTLAGSVLVASLLVAGVSRADDADRAFQEALSLYDAGKYPEACKRFAESYGLDPAMGTLQNLAACHEKEGKRALALREWLDLSDRAQRAQKAAQESLARSHIVELSTRLPRLMVRVDAKTGVDKVELDDEPFEAGKEVAIDPGRHRLAFSGAGRLPTTRPIDATEGHALEIDAPALDAVPAEPAATTGPIVIAPPLPAAPPRPRASSNMGWTLLGIGAASAAVGIPFGIAAILERSASDDHCPNERCTQRGVDLNDRAQAEAWAANVFIGLGVAVAGAGVVMLLLEKPAAAAATAWGTF
ncbi:MAG: hypothetical protein U0270_12630 [Labilithrix sp.]